ncbi:hypothetical protein QBC40DRAFT_346273 [Triangularia verruculosa]|uniref:Uncharacterized protein n=1 Tax=Triangularia verruculosa TaxID=2587418 RepID=A0AAN6XRT5_9PEZI|nr:hypothetical protein QBC40DRAFT_346273 [Triangularia verruculosa]
MTLYSIPEGPSPSPTISEYSLTSPPIVSPYWGLDLNDSARSISTDNCSSDALLKPPLPSSTEQSKAKAFFRKTRSKLSHFLKRIGLRRISGLHHGDSINSIPTDNLEVYNCQVNDRPDTADSYYFLPGLLCGPPQDQILSHLPAAAVRSQVAAAPPFTGTRYRGRYPHRYRGNFAQELELTLVQGALIGFPILRDVENGRCYSHSGSPGPVRAVYNDHDRSRFEVVYHDPSKPRRGRFHPFSKGRYVPGRS